MRQLGARQLQPDRLGAGGEQQLVEADRLAVAEHDAASRDIERGRGRAEAQLDRVLGVEFGRAQRDPFLERGTGEIVFRQVRSVDRRIRIGAHYRNRSVVPFAAQHNRHQLAHRSLIVHDEDARCAAICRRLPDRTRKGIHVVMTARAGSRTATVVPLPGCELI